MAALVRRGRSRKVYDVLTGTSNVLLASADNDPRPLSAPTRMSCRWCLARFAKTGTKSCGSRPKVLRDWQRYYGGNLLIVLPDAFWHRLLPARCPGLGR